MIGILYMLHKLSQIKTCSSYQCINLFSNSDIVVLSEVQLTGQGDANQKTFCKNLGMQHSKTNYSCGLLLTLDQYMVQSIWVTLKNVSLIFQSLCSLPNNQETTSKIRDILRHQKFIEIKLLHRAITDFATSYSIIYLHAHRVYSTHSKSKQSVLDQN